MSVICMYCKPKRAGPYTPPRSQVIATRLVHSHVQVHGRTRRTRTVQRTRKCKQCGYLWKTIEYVFPAKRGDNVGQFGKRKETSNGH